MSRPKAVEIRGAVTEHWMVKRLRENKSINDPTNVPRISAQTLVKLNDLRNSLLGSNYSVREWIDQLASNDPDYREHKKAYRKQTAGV